MSDTIKSAKILRSWFKQLGEGKIKTEPPKSVQKILRTAVKVLAEDKLVGQEGLTAEWLIACGMQYSSERGWLDIRFISANLTLDMWFIIPEDNAGICIPSPKNRAEFLQLMKSVGIKIKKVD